MQRHDMPLKASSRIVVGIDGFTPSIQAARTAAEWARTFGCQLELMCVWTAVPPSFTMVAEEWYPDRQAEKAAAEVVVAVFGASVPEWVNVRIPEGSAAGRLIEASRTYDLVIVGSRGHGGFAGLLLGSVSAAVAEDAHCPVLVVHETRTA
ncbi:universal stress protein [Humibacter sp. BT305]|nr:universal stress protein [Humibacter sp. BT305]